MDNTLFQLGVGGAVIILGLREMFQYLRGRNVSGDVVQLDLLRQIQAGQLQTRDYVRDILMIAKDLKERMDRA